MNSIAWGLLGLAQVYLVVRWRQAYILHMRHHRDLTASEHELERLWEQPVNIGQPS